MQSGEEFILTFPVFVVLKPPHEYLGLKLGDVHALALFTDQAAAEEWLQPGVSLEIFPDLAELLEHWRGLKQRTHVVLDPKKNKLAAFTMLSEFIYWLECDNPDYVGRDTSIRSRSCRPPRRPNYASGSGRWFKIST